MSMTLTVPEPMVRQLASGRMSGLTLVGGDLPQPGDWLVFVSDNGSAMQCTRRIAPNGVEADDFGSLRITLEPVR